MTTDTKRLRELHSQYFNGQPGARVTVAEGAELRSLILAACEELERENEKLTNARNYYEEIWKESCAHVGEACEILGVDPNKTPADTWTLADIRSRFPALDSSDTTDGRNE